MNTLVGAAILVAAFVAIALAGQWLVHRTISVEVLEAHHSAGEAMMGVVGTLFSVLLGFMVAGAMEQYNDARMYGSAEATNVASVFRIARGLSDVDRPRIRQLCREYANDVIDNEWPKMERHEKINHGWVTYQELWEACVAMVPENDRQAGLEQELVNAMRTLGENRRARLLLAQKNMPNALWWVIGVGALTTLSLSYVFASRFPRVQGVMTMLVAIAIALNIWLLIAYSNPFSGELAVKPTMFEMMRADILVVPDGPSRFLHDAPQPDAKPAAIKGH